MPGVHARPAAPRLPQRPGGADRGSLGADDRGTPWVASCTVTVDADDVETCSGPEAGDALSYAAFGDHGTREFFTHVRFHKHDDDRIVVHLLVELYARSAEEATEVLEEAARGTLAITSLAEESRPPASNGDMDPHRLFAASVGSRAVFAAQSAMTVTTTATGTVAGSRPARNERQSNAPAMRAASSSAASALPRRCPPQRPNKPRRTGPRSRADRAEELDWSCGSAPDRWAAITSRSGFWSRSETTSQVSATAIATIPTFSQPGGATIASRTPSVTQLSASSTAPAASPPSDLWAAHAIANRTAASGAATGLAPLLSPPERQRRQHGHGDERQVARPRGRVRDVPDREDDDDDRQHRHRRPGHPAKALGPGRLGDPARRNDDRRLQAAAGLRQRVMNASATT